MVQILNQIHQIVLIPFYLYFEIERVHDNSRNHVFDTSIIF
jgi:hypothetical protein